ncbi:P12 family lipoprotein (plasmid) [Borreliella yangtzensis]|uniref:P12 family lipoprotein n=1 Tax=Borreliella yangtzensis TaxID=683292 RepID=UPI003B22748E
MKKNILAIYILMLVSLLSCNISDPNESRNKKIENKGGGSVLGFIEKIQADRIKSVEQHIEKRKKQTIHTVPFKPVNVNKNFLYYPQEEIEIKEEALIPSTDEEKRVDKAIRDGHLKFDKLVYDENKLKNESEQLEYSFNNVYDEISKLKDAIQTKAHIVRRINHIIKTRPENREYQNSVRQNQSEKRVINNLLNKLLENRDDIEELHTQLDIGINERASAKYFFEQSQKTLKDSITERLKNEHISWSRKSYGDNLIRKANCEINNALEQLKTSSSRIVKAMEIKDRIEQLLEEVRSFLTSSRKKL